MKDTTRIKLVYGPIIKCGEIQGVYCDFFCEVCGKLTTGEYSNEAGYKETGIHCCATEKQTKEDHTQESIELLNRFIDYLFTDECSEFGGDYGLFSRYVDRDSFKEIIDNFMSTKEKNTGGI